MSSYFLYRLRVVWKTNGNFAQSRIPIFAFKPSHRGWDKMDIKNLDIFEQIADTANNFTKSLTVCSFTPYCYRALENRAIDQIVLEIKDSRFTDIRTDEKRTVATITCGDMNGLNQIAINREDIRMSCESLPADSLAAVPLDFTGDLKFQTVK
jgi:hypothetical protein